MILGEDEREDVESRGATWSTPTTSSRGYGADSLRLYEMFMGPLEAVKPWQSAQDPGGGPVPGPRVRDLHAAALGRDGRTTSRQLHRTIEEGDRRHRGDGVQHRHLRDDGLRESPELAAFSPPREAVLRLILLVSPFTPHLAEELWRLTGHERSLSYEPWPTYDEAFCVDDVLEIPVQVNGKVRGRVMLAKAASEEEARAAALGLESVAALSTGKQLKKFIYVAGKIVNIVVG